MKKITYSKQNYSGLKLINAHVLPISATDTFNETLNPGDFCTFSYSGYNKGIILSIYLGKSLSEKTLRGFLLWNLPSQVKYNESRPHTSVVPLSPDTLVKINDPVSFFNSETISYIKDWEEILKDTYTNFKGFNW